MQAVFTNICERTSNCKELTEIDCDTVIWRHCCNTSVSGVIAKKLNAEVHSTGTLPMFSLLEQLQSSKPPLGIPPAQKVFSKSFIAWASMAKKLHASLTSPSTMPNVFWSCKCCKSTLQVDSRKVFYTETNHNSLCGSPTFESGFGKCLENVTCTNPVKFDRGGIMQLGFLG